MSTQTAAPAASATMSASTAEASPEQNNEQVSDSTNTELDSTIAPPNNTVQAQQKVEEIKRNIKKLQLKVDGKTLEEEVDLDDNDFLTREFQKAKAFEKRAQDYSQLEKEVKTFIEELRKNPRKVLSDPNIGVDIKQLAASIIEEEIANSQKTPEQLEKEKLEAELKSIKAEREREKEESRQKEYERITEREYERYDTMMTQALEKSDLPKSPYVVKKMADYMLMGLKEGIDVSPEDVLPLVREEMQGDLKEMFAIMPDEVIEQIVGKDVFNRIRKKNLAKAKQTPPLPVSKSIPDTGNKKPETNKNVKLKTYKDFFGV